MGHRLHQAAPGAGSPDLLRRVEPGAQNPEEDGRGHAKGSHEVHARPRQETHSGSARKGDRDATRGIYPIQNCLIRKVKMVKKPKFDLTKLMELHSDSLKDDVGTEMLRPENEEAQNTLAA